MSAGRMVVDPAVALGLARIQSAVADLAHYVGVGDGDDSRDVYVEAARAVQQKYADAIQERDAERARADAAEAEVGRLRAQVADVCEANREDVDGLTALVEQERASLRPLALAAGLPATATPAEVVARVGEMRAFITRIAYWDAQSAYRDVVDAVPDALRLASEASR